MTTREQVDLSDVVAAEARRVEALRIGIVLGNAPADQMAEAWLWLAGGEEDKPEAAEVWGAVADEYYLERGYAPRDGWTHYGWRGDNAPAPAPADVFSAGFNISAGKREIKVLKRKIDTAARVAKHYAAETPERREARLTDKRARSAAYRARIAAEAATLAYVRERATVAGLD